MSKQPTTHPEIESTRQANRYVVPRPTISYPFEIELYNGTVVIVPKQANQRQQLLAQKQCGADRSKFVSFLLSEVCEIVLPGATEPIRWYPDDFENLSIAESTAIQEVAMVGKPPTAI